MMFAKYLKPAAGLIALLVLGFLVSFEDAVAEDGFSVDPLDHLVVAGPDTSTFSSSYGTYTVRTDSANCIYTEFMPNESVDCDSIVFIQTCKLTFWDGSKWVAKKPSDVWSGWGYRDGDTTADTTFVDHVFCEKDPYYNGDDPNDIGNKGSGGPSKSYIYRSTLAGETAATMEDCPRLYDGAYPSGTTKAKMEFEVAAVCADDGKVLGSFEWEYNRDKGDSGAGTDTVLTTGSAPDTVSPGFTAAKDTFVTNHKDSTGTAYCPEKALADALKAWLDIISTSLFYSPSDPLPGEMVTATFSIENIGSDEMVDIPVAFTHNHMLAEENIVAALMPGQSEEFDFTFMAEEGPNLVQFVVDFYGDHEELDEHNNTSEFLINANEPAAVPLFKPLALVLLVFGLLLTASLVIRKAAKKGGLES